MKIKSQIGLLLALPLLSQLAFCGLIVQTMNQTERAGQRETQAKQVLACCQSLRETLIRYISTIGARRFTDQATARQIRRITDEKSRQKLVLLRELLQDDKPASAILDRYAKEFASFSDLISDYSESHFAQGSPYLARFIGEGEYLEELMSTFNRLGAAEKAISARYEPVVEELRPASIAGRERLRQLLIATVIFNSMLVAVLAFVFNRSIAGRLQLLIKNIQSFASGEVSLSPLGGHDELTELDDRFRDMANARLELEELRQAMYGMVSHDLRGPLTTIEIQLELMGKEAGGYAEDNVRKTNQLIASEVNRLIRLCNSFLDFQQLERHNLNLNLALVPADSIVSQAVMAVSASARFKTIELKTSVAPCQIYCDGDRVVQVLVNLLINAVKFSKRGQAIDINVLPVDGYIRIEVVDRGRPIPEALRSKLFQPYSRLGQPENVENVGTGLGLYLSRMLTEAQGGKVGLADKGSGEKCFWLELPDKGPAAPARSTLAL